MGTSSDRPHASLQALPPELQALLDSDAEFACVRQFVARAAAQPRALIAFHDWTLALERELPERMAHTVALTIATRTRDESEHAERERAALATGMTHEEIDALLRLRAGSCPTFSDQEVAAAALARCLLDDAGHGCESALLRLSRLIGEPEATACLMLAARCAAHALMANTWGVRCGNGMPDAPPCNGRR